MRSAAVRMRSSLTSHYGGVRAVYEQAPFYAPGPYEAWLAKAVGERMGLNATHTLADLGGGSGDFASKVKAAFGARWLSVIEPSAEMLSGAEANAMVDSASCADAVSWAAAAPEPSKGPAKFDRILLKEVIHHIGATERPALFRALREQRLSGGEDTNGRLLIVTRPQRAIDYPMWPAAYEVWAQNQPSEEQLASELREAGFGSVHVHLHCYPHEVGVEEWCRLVHGRFWSTFSDFSDAKLEAGCEHIRGAAGADGVLRFEDRLLLIDAVAHADATE